MSTYRAYEPGPPGEDLSQIEAYDRGLTNDPGAWTQPVEFDGPELDPYTDWMEGLYERSCREAGIDPGTGAPGLGYAGPTWLAELDPGTEPGN